METIVKFLSSKYTTVAVIIMCGLTALLCIATANYWVAGLNILIAFVNVFILHLREYQETQDALKQSNQR